MLPVIFIVLLSLAGIYLFILLAWTALQRHLFRTITGIPELPALANERPHDRKIRGTAVIAGGRWVGQLFTVFLNMWIILVLLDFWPLVFAITISSALLSSNQKLGLPLRMDVFCTHGSRRTRAHG
jgi:hypothetical protein